VSSWTPSIALLLLAAEESDLLPEGRDLPFEIGDVATVLRMRVTRKTAPPPG